MSSFVDARLQADAEEDATRGLSQEAERTLVTRVQTSRGREREEATRSLLHAFKPFLGARVAAFLGLGIDRTDLEQEARIGFVRAIEKFDLSQPTRLSSYAHMWVVGALRRFVARDRLIRVPERPARELAQLRAVLREHSEGFGAEATMQELEAETGMSSERIIELLHIPDGVVSLDEIADGEAKSVTKQRPGGWARAAAVFSSECEDEVRTDVYDTGELRVLVDEYQGLRSQVEMRTSALEEPRLRRRGSHVVNLVRVMDLDRALQRVAGRQFVALELAGMRDLPLRELEDLLLVRHSTFADRKTAGVKWMCGWLNGELADCRVRRQVFWRRLFAWNLRELRGQGEPMAFEVWARLAGGDLWTGEKRIPVQAMAGFGEGWLLTPELLGRDVVFDETNEDNVGALVPA